MHSFLNWFEARLSKQFLVKYHNNYMILPAVMILRKKSLISTVFSMFNVVVARVDYFQDIFYRN